MAHRTLALTAVVALIAGSAAAQESPQYAPPLGGHSLTSFAQCSPQSSCAEDLLQSCGEDSGCGESCFGGGHCGGFLDDLGIVTSGYIQQSVNTNSVNPRNPPGGAGNWPGAGWIYRNDEYMLNRVYLTLSRTPDTSCGQWDIGGAVDVLYGTDYQFLQSRGLETHTDFTNKWNSGTGSGLNGIGLMGLAMPQAYLELANEDVSVKLGHFYHPLGFVRLDLSGASIGNTGTYSMFYGEFLPVTGGMVDVKATDQITLTGGIHRGSGNWTDNNDNLNGFVGANWQSADGTTLIMYKGDFGAEDAAGNNDQYIQSVVFEQKIGDRTAFIVQSDYGLVTNAGPGGSDATFYSIINMLGYQFTEKLHGGIRYELFHDVDGTRVAPAPGAGVWNAVSVGGTYKICPNLWFRPEVRWDCFDGAAGVSNAAFGNGTEDDQFLASFSVFMFL